MKTLFHDDVLRFLYKSEMFQQLAEEEQVSFLNDFARDEQFAKSVAVALDFKDQLGELTATVPEIGQVEFDKSFVMKDYTKTEGNVTYFPFGEKVDYAAPLVIVMDTSDALATHEIQVKGLLLPLLELCTQQQRDCVVIVNGRVFVFPHGQIKYDVAVQIHEVTLTQTYSLTESVVQAMQVFKQYVVKEDAELMFMTAGTIHLPIDVTEHIKNQQLELSVIALNTHVFERYETTQFDKAFFPNEKVASIL